MGGFVTFWGPRVSRSVASCRLSWSVATNTSRPTTLLVVKAEVLLTTRAGARERFAAEAAAAKAAEMETAAGSRSPLATVSRGPPWSLPPNSLRRRSGIAEPMGRVVPAEAMRLAVQLLTSLRVPSALGPEALNVQLTRLLLAIGSSRLQVKLGVADRVARLAAGG